MPGAFRAGSKKPPSQDHPVQTAQICRSVPYDFGADSRTLVCVLAIWQEVWPACETRYGRPAKRQYWHINCSDLGVGVTKFVEWSHGRMTSNSARRTSLPHLHRLFSLTIFLFAIAHTNGAAAVV